MPRAIIKDNSGVRTVVADSNETIVIEGNHYFPPDSVNQELFVDSDLHTVCHWKGKASYKSISIGDQEYDDCVWYYPNPEPSSIKRVGLDYTNYYAFWRNVEVEV